MKKFSLTVRSENGLDAPKAEELIKKLMNYSSRVIVRKKSKEANARIIFNLLSLTVKKDDTVEFIIEGEDESAEAESLQGYLKEELKL